MQVVGLLKFDKRNCCIYGDPDFPYMKLRDIAALIDYDGDYHELLDLCEDGEYEYVTNTVSGLETTYISEKGLYNILAQSRSVTARKWRSIIFDQLIEYRRGLNRSIVDQFEDWDSRLDDIYYDEETGKLMMTQTTDGGDTVQDIYDERLYEA